LTVTKKVLQTEDTNSLALFKISPSFDKLKVFSAGISPFMDQWQDWLGKDSAKQADMNQTLQHIIANLNKCFKAGEVDETILTTQSDIRCARDISKAHAYVVHQLLSGIKKTPLFTAVTNFLTHHGENQHLDRLGCIDSKLCPVKARYLTDKLTTAHFVVMFLLSWPYKAYDSQLTNNNDVLNRLVVKMLSECHENVLGRESNVLRKQFSSLLKLQKDKMSTRDKCRCYRR
jgi:hypothetical protein